MSFAEILIAGPMIFNLRKSAAPSIRFRDINIDGLTLPVILRRNVQARRFILKISRKNREVIVTMPSHAREAEAMDFVISQAHWIQERIAAQPEIVAFVPGARVPLRDVKHTIEHRPGERGTVWIGRECDRMRFGPGDGDDPVICVAGDERHLARRLRDWLKKQARQDLTRSVENHSRCLGLASRGLSIRDQTTRWGSCSSTGSLSFSWRLILAPSYVLDYVAAHEVAHLAEMNHGPNFWKLVEQSLPEYRHAQKWLKLNGADLHIYG